MRIPGYNLNHRSPLLPFRLLGMNPLEYLTILQGAYSRLNGFDVASLFANGEQGFWYDHNDFSTLFQDAAGTTPVTAADQPVGLQLDKSKGLVLGPEKVTNGTFETSSGWTIGGSGASITDSALVLNLAAANTLITNSATTYVSGIRYKASVTVSGYAAGALRLQLSNGSSAPSVDGPMISSNGQHEFFFVSNGNTTLRVISPTAGGTFTIDNISVRELPGNHRFQTAAASRPMLRYNATTGSHYLAYDGSDDFLVTNAINFTGTDKVSVFAGVRKLSDIASCIMELSGTANSGAGVFNIISGSDTGGVGYNSLGRGSATANALQIAKAFTYTAPDQAVLTATHDIAADLSTIRRNGVNGTSAVADKGIGNFGNYPLYFGRRAGTSLPFNGHEYSPVCVGRLTTVDEMANIERLLADQVGVVLP